MRYCPVCWTHRKLSNAYYDIRWWWLYKVLKRPEPDAKEAILKMVPSLVSAMIGIKIVDEMVKALDEDYKKQREKADAKLRKEK